ncbi:trypsin-like serine peptidase [Microbispora sp. NBC_01389]|uniref:trypsin-like serine peptidase n=1 Tax=Microbispora sp. NBC_01389 TaxID=2903584 RepID=UPI00325429E2
MKRILAPLAGAVATSALLGMVVPAPARAYDITVTSPLVPQAEVSSTLAYWLGNGARAFAAATPYLLPVTITATPVPRGDAEPDGDRGVVPAVAGARRVPGVSRNVNLPRTAGRVFFVGADHRPHWCAGTSVQADHRNLVATAGHCVYEPGRRPSVAAARTYRHWVFVPGFSRAASGATAPLGVYPGKQAFAHQDFTRYGDLDRDYAFVSVHDGVLPRRVALSGAARYAAFTGPKYRTRTGYTGVLLTRAGRLGDKVGEQGLAYNLPVRGSLAVFGYPVGPASGAAPTGLRRSYGRPFRVWDLTQKADELVAVRAPFVSAGGSPWLAAYRGGRGLGYLNGLTIGMSGQSIALSPYFDGELFHVYDAARHERVPSPA